MTDFFTMKELGAKLGGMSSHVIGRKLKELGLRTGEGKPSRQAFEQQLVSQRFTDDGSHYLWAWSERTIHLLAELRSKTKGGKGDESLASDPQPK